MNVIKKGLIEGKFLFRLRRKTISSISKFFLRQEEKIDLLIGKLFRKYYINQIPVQNNKVVFCSFQGDYTCNPKYIAEEMIRQNLDCDMVWIGRKNSAKHPELFPAKFSKVIEWYTMDAFHELGSAKVFVCNSVEIFKKAYPKKAGQYIIQTWHGSLGIKRFDKSVNSGKAWVKAAVLSGEITDFCISNSTFETDIYRSTFWDKTEILEYGHPRNDPLIKSTSEEKAEIRKRIFEYAGREDLGEKIILYAPTFRDSKKFDCYNLEPVRLIQAVEEKFGDKWIAIYRYHPTVRKLAKDHIYFNENVIDLTLYPDMQDLILIADIGITDYSSWIYDFMLTGNPGFIFATDINLYNNERGFAYALETTPFKIAVNNDEMIENIHNFNWEQYKTENDAFLKGKGCVEDGHASERVVEKIKTLINTHE